MRLLKTMSPNVSRARQYVFAVVLALVAALAVPAAPAAASDPCGAGSNPIVCENSQPGTPMSDWYSPNAWGDIAGFPTTTSVSPGGTVNFKISSPTTYTIEIYRLGWYGGDGARLMPTSPTTTFGVVSQPACDTQTSTGMVDCGNWRVTNSWAVPSTAVSGVYIAAFDQTGGAGYMPYPFVVNNPSSHSDIVVQTDDETWQAYNTWGPGNADLYVGSGPAPDGRDYSVSYNRPMDVAGDNGVFGSEYGMIQWLERNGYDTSYLSGVDVSTQGSLLLNHKIFMSDGHDEYWDQQQWNAATSARAAGVNLAFFSGNDVFWRTQLQPSIADGAANRTVDEYKMTKMEFNPPDGVADPSGTWTGTWMDPAGAGIGGNSPQNQLTGTLFDVNGYRSDAITVAYPYSTDRIWRNTSVAALGPGQSYAMQTGTLGYEWDSDVANSVRPSGEIDLSSTTIQITEGSLMLDDGNTYGNGVATHNLTLYRDPHSHALVFSSGTVQWSWGLSTVHYDDITTHEDPVMQQATANLLADMGVFPLTLQSGLVMPTQSADTTPPTVVVTSPTSGSTVPAMQPLTISGTASDVGGVVARVEVSVDGGNTWNPATGLGSWSYSWTPTALGSATIEVRAEDDSDNTSTPVSIPITVGPESCPCTIFPTSATPGTPDSSDGSSVNVGVKFSATKAGEITGVRFYKAATNTGTHVGSLWTSTGQLLGSVTFSGETTSGWQTANFSSPIPVRANTEYVISYLAPSGHYSVDTNYFTNHGAGLPPITALQAGGATGANGVYGYGSTTAFPTQSYENSNYWVDPVFLDVSSTTPPTVTATTPSSSATNVPINSAINAKFSEGVDPSTLNFTLKDQSGNAVNGTTTYDQSGHVATFAPNGQLAMSTTYTASVQATDLWGNTMASPYTWTFTTASTPPSFSCPCSLWGGTATPAVPSTYDTNSVEVGTVFESAVAGYITGLSFYKGSQNTGTHTGSLWSASGTQLATGTFTGETASGWQSLTFSSAVAISANTPYVVSYHAPNGFYSSTSAYFNGAVSNYPLTALASASAAHGNGVYAYGSTSVFPTNSYNATNYWVDPTFTTSPPGGASAVTTTLADTSTATNSLAAKVNGASPDDTATTPQITNKIVGNVQPVMVSFPAPIQPQSLRIKVTTTVAAEGSESPAHTLVPGSVVYDPTTHSAVFHSQAPLNPGSTYNAVATARNAIGIALAPITWSFTVASTTSPTSPAPAPLNGRVLPAAPLASEIEERSAR
ncbi:MAG TPA: DUF4082 domain-containing protein [Actinocrinis sp.]|nr:DUF4082 domain-containing protein [Actinocrinis sp.]